MVILYLFSGTRTGRTRGWIFTVYGSYDVVSPKNGLFGGVDNIAIHLG